MDSQDFEEEEENYICPLCNEIYGTEENHIRAPKLIDCGDSICKSCLKKFIEREKGVSFNCPFCKQKITKKEKIEDYTTNKQMIKYIKSLNNLREIDAANKDKKKPKNYNIIILGNSGVGKTSIFQRLTTDKFPETYSETTIGVDPSFYYIKYKRQNYELILYDTSGQEKNKSMTKEDFPQSDGAIFVYDISDRKSFDDIKEWYNFYQEEKGEVYGILIGNKCDLGDKERKVKFDEAKKFAEKRGLALFEVSAKLNNNDIIKAFTFLLEIIVESKDCCNNIETIKIDKKDKQKDSGQGTSFKCF